MFHEGQQIGCYTLINKLGQGGFGEVWLAENRSNAPSEKVAIKLPRKDQIDLSAVKEEIFNWTLSGKHKNILPIIECETFGNQIAIVSEFAPNGSLQDLLNKQDSLSIVDAVEITIGILNGLAHLHKRKIIHRDLKPDNILFQGKIPRLTDFGISRAMPIDSYSQTVSGTLCYMAPEAFDGKRNAQTDIWSVGVILYQLLTGNLPFPQKEKTALIGAIVMHDPEPLPNSIPLVLQKIVKKSLEKELSKRYETADEMRKEVEFFLHSQEKNLSPFVAQTNIIAKSESAISVRTKKQENIRDNVETKFKANQKQKINCPIPPKSTVKPSIGGFEEPKTFPGNYNAWSVSFSFMGLGLSLGIYAVNFLSGNWNADAWDSGWRVFFIIGWAIIGGIFLIMAGLFIFNSLMRGINSYLITTFNLLFIILGIFVSIYSGIYFSFLLIPPLLGCIVGSILGELIFRNMKKS